MFVGTSIYGPIFYLVTIERSSGQIHKRIGTQKDRPQRKVDGGREREEEVSICILFVTDLDDEVKQRSD